MQILLYVLAFIASLLQVFDVLSTNLVISKGRGHEANGLVARWQAWAGDLWWIYKLPLIAVFVSIAMLRPDKWAVGVLVLVIAVYAYAVQNNYRVAWRQL